MCGHDLRSLPLVVRQSKYQRRNSTSYGSERRVRRHSQRAHRVCKKGGSRLESGLGWEARKMLRATNVDRDTALHMAVRNCHLKKKRYLDVIRLLTEEDPEFEHPANSNEETPLYLAAERGSVDVVVMLLETCTSPTYGGPGGRTALHAATFTKQMFNDSFTDGVLKKLLEWKQDLIKEPDAYGWTPLHSAARRGNVEAVKKLFEKDKSVVYAAANGDEGNTALHIAAAVGYVRVMEELLSYCPDCWEMVNSKRQNILHIAAYYEYERHWATDFILERPWAAQLINQKDNEGNTPLHLLASTRKDKGLYEYRKADTGVVNNKNWTPVDINYGEDICKDWPRQIWHNNGRDTVRKDRERIINWTMNKEERENQEQVDKKQKDKEREDKIRAEGMAKTHMIVATLLATISFAPSFTIPGGYHQDGLVEGTTILVRDAAFNVFVITNTVVVICSTSSVFLYLSASLFNLEDEEEKVTRRYLIALWLVIIALFATMLAFVTGSYAVLGHSLNLAIPICVIACFSFMVYASELTKLIDAQLVA